MKRIGSIIGLVLFVIAALTATALAQIPADTIYPGSLQLPKPFLGSDTVDSYKQVGDSTVQTNTWIRDVKAALDGDRSVLRITTTHISLPDSDITRNLLIVDARDLSLIHQEVRAAADSGMVTCDTANHITGWNKLPKRDQMIVDRQYDRRVFPDDGIGPWLFGLLPLKLHYAVVVPQFNLWTGTEKALTVEVVSEEELVNGDVRIPCWIIEMSGGGGPPGYKQRRWISKTSRRMLRQTATRGPDDPRYSAVMRHWF